MRAPAQTLAGARPRWPITCRGLSLAFSQCLSLFLLARHEEKQEINRNSVFLFIIFLWIRCNNIIVVSFLEVFGVNQVRALQQQVSQFVNMTQAGQFKIKP